MKMYVVVSALIIGILNISIDTGGPASAAEDPCTLLTKEEVQDALKKNMKEPKRFMSECTYETLDRYGSFTVKFIVQISTDGVKGFNENKESREMKPVEGLGDSAYFSDNVLHVLKGPYHIIFHSSADSEYHPSREVMKLLANKAIGRLR